MQFNRNHLAFPLIIYIILVIYLVITYFVLPLDDQVLAAFIAEDHIYEVLTAVALLATSVLFVIAFSRSLRRDDHGWLKRLSYLALAAIYFVGFGEEISWGQRIFGLASPESVQAVNVQDELTFHNLAFLSGSDRLITTDRLATLFFFSLFLVIPLAALFIDFAGKILNRLLPVVPWTLGLLFLTNYGLANGLKPVLSPLYSYSGTSLSGALTEIKEANYAVLSVVAAVYVVWVILKPDPVTTPDPDPEMQRI